MCTSLNTCVNSSHVHIMYKLNEKGIFNTLVSRNVFVTWISRLYAHCRFTKEVGLHTMVTDFSLNKFPYIPTLVCVEKLLCTAGCPCNRTGNIYDVKKSCKYVGKESLQSLESHVLWSLKCHLKKAPFSTSILRTLHTLSTNTCLPCSLPLWKTDVGPAGTWRQASEEWTLGSVAMALFLWHSGCDQRPFHLHYISCNPAEYRGVASKIFFPPYHEVVQLLHFRIFKAT